MVTKQESAATTTASAPPLTPLSAPALGRSEKQLAAVESTSDHPAKRAEPGEVRTSVGEDHLQRFPRVWNTTQASLLQLLLLLLHSKLQKQVGPHLPNITSSLLQSQRRNIGLWGEVKVSLAVLNAADFLSVWQESQQAVSWKCGALALPLLQNKSMTEESLHVHLQLSCLRQARLASEAQLPLQGIR